MNLEDNKIKLTIQKRIVVFSVLLFVGKIIAYFLTNSLGILTDALESIVNVTAGFISLYSIYLALKPKDENHPYGHGKVELISASIEGFLILLVGLVIIFESIKRLIFPPSGFQQLDIGIIIIAVAGAINYILGYYSISIGKKHNSMALIAGGKHLQSDTYSTIGLVIGLILLYFTKLVWLDSAIAMLFGLIIVYTGYKILRETTAILMDEADFKLIESLTEIIWEYKSENWIDIHNFKIVKYGSNHHIDCDLTLPWYFNIVEAHKETDALKEVIISHYTENVDLTFHTDACNVDMCKFCKKPDCKERKQPFENEVKWTVESFISGKSILKTK